MNVFPSYVCIHISVCVPQLYTQPTVILDDPDFPRLTLSVSQLSRSNLAFSLSLSVTNKYTDPAVEYIRPETDRSMHFSITHAHVQNMK